MQYNGQSEYTVYLKDLRNGIMDRALFVKHPRVIEDLQKPHLVTAEQPYEVAKEITLATIDYENFITDMEADRRFIENNAALCSEGKPVKCLLVRQHGRNDGVLVVPEYKSFVKWAAYVADAE